jgi:putative oxidoreductase
MNKIAERIIRILLGVALVVFGLNGFLQFMPMDLGAPLVAAIGSMGGVFLVVKALEIVIGVFLLANRFSALALVALLPITINFVLFHLFLDIANIVPGLVLLIFNVVLMFNHKKAYKLLLKA